VYVRHEIRVLFVYGRHCARAKYELTETYLQLNRISMACRCTGNRPIYTPSKCSKYTRLPRPAKIRHARSAETKRPGNITGPRPAMGARDFSGDPSAKVISILAGEYRTLIFYTRASHFRSQRLYVSLYNYIASPYLSINISLLI